MCLKPSFEYSSYILVVDTFKQHQFPVGTLGMGLILERPAQLFNCHWYAEDCVQSRASHGLRREKPET